jgi:hypothetical protein
MSQAGSLGKSLSGNLVLLSSQTPSAAASVNFTSVMSSTYTNYSIVIYDLFMSASTPLAMKVSTDNGATWIAGTSYVYGGLVMHADGVTGAYSNAGGDQFNIVDRYATAATNVITAQIYLYDTLSTTHYKTCIWQANCIGNVYGGAMGNINCSGYIDQTAVVNAIKFFPVAGTFTGNIKLYGVVN